MHRQLREPGKGLTARGCAGRTQLTGMQPIHKACMYGQKSAVEQMRELGPVLLSLHCLLPQCAQAHDVLLASTLSISMALSIAHTYSLWFNDPIRPPCLSVSAREGADIRCATNWAQPACTGTVYSSHLAQCFHPSLHACRMKDMHSSSDSSSLHVCTCTRSRLICLFGFFGDQPANLLMRPAAHVSRTWYIQSYILYLPQDY